ncbi:hypothetical protein AB0E63_27260 [Kribbella sp. NPDC026596]|uniref:hypothetical protein n=1 Tax=Kribbella sp. NPDC026596 TaxID=3155122 RepID=UPI0033CFC9A3
MRRFALPAAALAGVLLLSSCGSKDSNDGGLPVPAGGDTGTSTSTTSPTETSQPTTEPSRAATTKKPTSAHQQIIVEAGNFGSNPAVQGLVSSYPLYFQALVSKDDTVLKKSFPSFWYADVSQAIFDAQRNGWVMRPPGSVVVMGVKSQQGGIVRVKTCRSQTTQYWDPKAKNWIEITPKGSPQVIDMVLTGRGWLPYRLAPSTGVNCSGVRYPY